MQRRTTGPREVAVVERRIEHDVAHLVHARRNPLADEIGDGSVRRAEQEGREAVCDDAVDLFRHSHVEGAQARLDVCDRDVQFGSGERSCER